MPLDNTSYTAIYKTNLFRDVRSSSDLDGQTLDHLHLLVFLKPIVTSFGEEKTWWLYGKRVQWHLWSVRFSQQLKLRS